MRIMGYTEWRKKTKTYWYRRVVPARLRGHVPLVAGFPDNPSRTEFNKNLNVVDKAAASRAAARIDALVQPALDAAEARAEPRVDSARRKPNDAVMPRNMPSVDLVTRTDSVPLTERQVLTPARAFDALENWEEAELKRCEIEAFNSEPGFDFSDTAMVRSRLAYQLKSRGGANWWTQIEGFDNRLSAVLVAAGMDVPPTHPALSRLRVDFATRWARVLRAQDLMKMGQYEWVEVAESSSASRPAMIPTPPKRDDGLVQLTLEDMLASYLREADATTRIAPKSKTEIKRVFELFIQYVGPARLASDIRPPAVRDFRDFVLTLPARPKNIDLELTARQVASKYALLPEIPRKSWKTAGKYLDFLSAVFGHGRSLDAISSNPVAHAKFKVGRRARKQSRAEFSDDDLKTIFSSPLFMGCAGVERHHKEGDHVLWGARYWCMLLTATTGARINELGQLLVADVRTDSDNIVYLSINLDSDYSEEGVSFEKTVKTSSSIRNLPLHSRMIDLGFLDYCKEMMRRDHRHLFPELLHGRSGVEPTKELSRWYGRYFSRIGIIDTSKVYHSFRHWIIARLGANTPDYLRRRITGHAAGSEGDRYGGAAAMRDILNALESLPLGFLAQLQKPSIIRWEIDLIGRPGLRAKSDGKVASGSSDVVKRQRGKLNAG